MYPLPILLIFGVLLPCLSQNNLFTESDETTIPSTIITTVKTGLTSNSSEATVTPSQSNISTTSTNVTSKQLVDPSSLANKEEIGRAVNIDANSSNNNTNSTSSRDEIITLPSESTEFNPCIKDNGNCSSICFFMGNGTYKCGCTHGKLSSVDNRTCEPPQSFVVFSRARQLDFLPIDNETGVDTPYPSISDETFMKNVIAVTFDYEKERIIYSDIKSGTINSVFFNGTDHQIIVDNQGAVEGMSFDLQSKDLWFTSNNDSSVNKINLRIAKFPHKIISLSPDDKLRGIAVHGCKDFVYWANWNTQNPSIQRAYVSGFNITSIITKDIKMPNAVTIDHQLQKLYWSDARLDKIERCDLDGSNRHLLLLKTPRHPFAMTVYGPFIFWTDWVARGVFRADKLTGDDVILLRRNIPRPLGITAVAPDAEDCQKNPCAVLNGGCTDNCEVTLDMTVKCSCYAGRTLLPDKHRCINEGLIDRKCNSTDFECEDGICIPYELTCDSIKHCKGGSDEDPKLCANRACPFDFYRCVNGKCIHDSKVCDGFVDCPDHADEINCTCAENMFKCANGPCIPLSRRCDKDQDCSDLSDEFDCPPADCNATRESLGYNEGETFIHCNKTSICIHPEWRCDDSNDCLDWSDEADCPPKHNVSAGEHCGSDWFQCKTGLCIPIAWRCDRDNDCEHENTSVKSDEQGCSYVCHDDQFQCSNQDCIPHEWICDGHHDCLDGSDEDKTICNARECPPDSFNCTSGQCIPQYWVCDGDVDCFDGSDEKPPEGCKSTACKPNEYSCKNFQCIMKRFFCDGDDDCGDRSDEPPNCMKHQCLNDQFECKDKNCIPKLWICNETPDCPDKSDEDPELCKNNKTTTLQCQSNLFQCANGACVDPNKLCDGENNCGDYSDENKCNVNECQWHQSDCPQICEDMPIGYKCSCHEGFEAVDGGKLCKDIDECKVNRPCSQICRNTYGSFTCSCVTGYTSINNGSSCKSNSNIEPTILFSGHHSIAYADLKGHSLSLKATNLTNAVGLDFDWKENCIYWSEVSPLGSSIKRGCSEFRNVSLLEPSAIEKIHTNHIQSPDGLAVDWIARNLYWCDRGREIIEVSKLDGSFRKVLLHEDLQVPRAIALDPSEGYMYWTDWGENPYIGKAGMDGSNPMRLINESLGWPNALTIDYITRELFWADAKEDYISVASLDGSRRDIIVHRGNSRYISHVFALSVFEDFLYWTEWEGKVIAKCHKYHCQNSVRVLNISERPMDIQIHHPYRQPIPKFENPCNSLNCSGLCLLKPGTIKASAVCACPEDYILGPSGRICIANCSDNQFECKKTMKCISKNWVCDKQDDCGDGSDEPEQCRSSFCDSGNFACKNGTCIPALQFCDGITQCDDGSDEECEHNLIDYCAECTADGCESICLNGGTCYVENNQAKCHCQNDYNGTRCEFNVCGCQNGATCVNSNRQQAKCLCPPGFTGKNCESVVDPICDGFNCHNGGYCLVKDNQPYCKCPPDWIGDKCEKFIKNLEICSRFCLNGGNCTITGGHLPPICRCPPGWIGPRCQVDEKCKGFCLNGGLCKPGSDKQKSPYCTCPPLYEGKRCEKVKFSKASGSMSRGYRRSPDWKVAVTVITTCIVVVTIVFLIMFGLRMRARSRAFMHRRIDESAANLEISNPMFGDDVEDDCYSTGTPSQSFSLKSDDKSTNFSNPMYEFQQTIDEEKRNLLVEKNDMTEFPKDELNGGSGHNDDLHDNSKLFKPES